jgi:hypothetical protein
MCQYTVDVVDVNGSWGLELHWVDGPSLVAFDLVESYYCVASAAFGFEPLAEAAWPAALELYYSVLTVACVAGVLPIDDSRPDNLDSCLAVVHPSFLAAYLLFHG